MAACRPVRPWPIAAAAGPLRRTTPTPPCPAGVATATMVSSVENTAALAPPAGTAASRVYLLTEMMTVFSNESPMLSVPTDGMSATAMCTMRRS